MNVKSQNKKSSIKILLYVLVFFIYLFLSWYFWGFPFGRLNKVILGYGTDPISFVWGFNWLKYSLIHVLNPFTSLNILNPIGVNIAWSPGNSFTADLFFLPITLKFGPIVSYNVLTIFSPSLSAFTAFLLCKYLSKKTIPSLISGYIYGFSSYEIGQLIGHLNLFTIFLIPLIVLVCILFYQNKIKKFLFSTILSLLLILQFGFSLEIFTSLTFFGYIGLIVAFAFVNKQCRKDIMNLGIWVTLSYIFSMIILSPFLYYLYIGLHHTPAFFNDSSYYSSDLLNYIIPTPITWLGGNLLSHISLKFPGNFSEEGAYVGIPLIIIFSLYIKEFWHTFHGKLLTISGLIIIIASFGPLLHILGIHIIRTPWELLRHLPFIKQALPTRFPLYLSLVLAIIVAIWVSSSKYNNFFKYSIAVLSLVFLIPNLNSSFKATQQEINIPLFFTQKFYLKYIEPNSNVLIIPYSYNGNSALWQVESNMYFNMVDYPWCPVPLNKWYWLNSNIVSNLIADAPNNVVCIDELKGFLGSNNISTVILSNDEYKKWNNVFNNILGEPLFVGGVVLYSVPKDIISKYNNYNDVIAQCNLQQFSVLFSVSEKFLENDNQLANLYPKYLEEHGYLDKSFGYQTGPAINWTSNNGWIGKWGCPDGKGECFGVGIVGDLDQVKPIIDKYKSEALQIFFPYPAVYDPASSSGKGQLLIIFRTPKSN